MSDPRAGVGETAFSSHAEAVAALTAALAPWFDLYAEVAMGSSQIDGKVLRADLVAVDRQVPDRVIAFEAKCGFYRMSQYSQAIKQAVDYRLATLSGGDEGMELGKRVSAIFVFPRWGGGHDKLREYAPQAIGMEILSHHFRVGFAEFRGGAVNLTINNTRLWTNGVWSKTAPGLLAAKDRVGSTKVFDPLKITKSREQA